MHIYYRLRLQSNKDMRRDQSVSLLPSYELSENVVIERTWFVVSVEIVCAKLFANSNDVMLRLQNDS